jgi:periplasmic copper chaperone A
MKYFLKAHTQQPQSAPKNILITCIFSAISLTASAQNASAPVDVKAAWARATVPGQKATGAFMTLTAKEPLQLTAGSSPVAGIVEIHEMKMDGDVMKMRALPNGLALPAGKAVELKPGGYHVMLMDLKAALPKDSQVPVSLVFKDAKGMERKLELKLPVTTTAPHGAGHHGHP